MKQKVMIICPMLREYHCARECFGAVEEEEAPFRTACSSLGNCELRIICSGMVTEKSVALIKERFGTPDLLIESGTAGGLSGVEMGDILAGETFLYPGNAEICQSLPGWAKERGCREGRVITVDDPVTDRRGRSRIEDLAHICTMESYHLASAAGKWGCGFFSLRVVTDLADEYTSVNFKKNFRPCCMKLYGRLKDMLLSRSH